MITAHRFDRSRVTVFFGLLIAAAASIATSAPPSWHRSDTRTARITLGPTHTSTMLHVAVQGSSDVTIHATANPPSATADAGAGDAPVDAVADGATNSGTSSTQIPRVTFHLQAEALDGGAPPSTGTSDVLGAPRSGCTTGCDYFLTASVSSTSPPLQDVDIDVVLEASIEGDGDNAPADAFVTIVAMDPQ